MNSESIEKIVRAIIEDDEESDPVAEIFKVIFRLAPCRDFDRLSRTIKDGSFTSLRGSIAFHISQSPRYSNDGLISRIKALREVTPTYLPLIDAKEWIDQHFHPNEYTIAPDGSFKK